MSRRTSLRVLTAGLLVSCVVGAWAGPAGAHADLQSTEPGYGASLPAPPDRVLVRYDLPVEVDGAQVKLTRAGKAVKVAKPVHASPDRRDVAIKIPEAGGGSYTLTWFLFGSDGDVMGGELAFTVQGAGAAPQPATAAPAPGTATAPLEAPSFAPLARAQDSARLFGFMSLIVLVGGVAFVALLWRDGAGLRRTRILLWGSLAVALLANTASLGLKGAAVQGESALAAFSPSALTALDGTHVGRVLVARLAFFVLAIPVVAYLTLAPRRALHSHRWAIGAVAAGLGAVATHGMLSHAYARGRLASAIDVVHLSAVAVWLGGLVMLAVVVLPRRRRAELAAVVPRWSSLAFGAVATAVVAGTTLLVLISPSWGDMPSSGYGRTLAVKLGLVALVLVVANRARTFVRRHLPGLTAVATSDGPSVEVPSPAPVPVAVGVGAALAAPAPSEGPAGIVARPAPEPEQTVEAMSLRPFVTAVTAELCLAAGILTATTFLVGRSPPT